MGSNHKLCFSGSITIIHFYYSSYLVNYLLYQRMIGLNKLKLKLKLCEISLNVNFKHNILVCFLTLVRWSFFSSLLLECHNIYIAQWLKKIGQTHKHVGYRKTVGERKTLWGFWVNLKLENCRQSQTCHIVAFARRVVILWLFPMMVSRFLICKRAWALKEWDSRMSKHLRTLMLISLSDLSFYFETV